jgi:alanyl-tRNA synthetase
MIAAGLVFAQREAIEWAWELLTEVWGLDKDRLYVSYFGGNEDAGLPVDTEARDIWLSLGLPPSRVCCLWPV